VPDLTIVAGETGITASFTLIKGAFATIVMRELMKVDDDHLSVVREDDE
jgi:tRNA(Glu) U13 pseudouridine synthase TruD